MNTQLQAGDRVIVNFVEREIVLITGGGQVTLENGEVIDLARAESARRVWLACNTKQPN